MGKGGESSGEDDEDWDDEDEETMQIVMFAFDFVIERILKELD